ncbi:zinc-binding dehydrogenase [Amycolatopsis rhizosphaerae]|uniref:Zinc-binding dehydrogenase n=1 Tax=Amycolatopsis rhizosphaerae TaxID=2053003 RepID=A0A558CTR7_9PSEU|nr:zinc-binding dehydrogenase [Amycolatopsis rhizosphaerae]TVT52092.1 zinc-binding dehydrogenase [Amycolatopsis rhizosphaerae]
MTRSRAAVVRRFGGPEVLEITEVATPRPGPGQIAVRVRAIGVGFTDLMARSGDYLLQRRLPFTPGYELVGELDDGRLVAMSLPKMGAYRDHVVVPSWLPVPLPDGLDPVAAATIPLDYLTALSLLEKHARVETGDAVFIQGAGGGVGAALSRLGKLKGLKMYGTASSPDRLSTNGVRFIDYRSQDFETVLAEEEPDGVRAVFDHLGGAMVRKGYRALAPGGVLVSYAFSGRPGHMVADTVKGAIGVGLRGLLPGKRTALCMVPREVKSDHTWYRDSLRRLLDLAAEGAIHAEAGAVFPLAEAAEVHRALQHREITGKVVLTTE